MEREEQKGYEMDLVELARDIYFETRSPTEVRKQLREITGKWISPNTIRDWVYYRTRYKG